MTEKITVYEAVNAVMQEVKSVTKDGKNTFDKYNFRGIDGTVNAVGPALRKHGVIAVPMVEHLEKGTATTGKGAVMTTINLQMRTRWYGPAGDYFDSITWGEAFDRGDKATAKAHSVAFRTALLETLCLPTQEPDPDEFSYERSDEMRKGYQNDLYRRTTEATTVETLQELWQEANKAGFDDLKQQIAQRAEKMKADGASS